MDRSARDSDGGTLIPGLWDVELKCVFAVGQTVDTGRFSVLSDTPHSRHNTQSIQHTVDKLLLGPECVEDL